MEYYLVIISNKTGSMWMDLESLIQSEVSQKEKKRKKESVGQIENKQQDDGFKANHMNNYSKYKTNVLLKFLIVYFI